MMGGFTSNMNYNLDMAGNSDELKERLDNIRKIAAAL